MGAAELRLRPRVGRPHRLRGIAALQTSVRSGSAGRVLSEEHLSEAATAFAVYSTPEPVGDGDVRVRNERALLLILPRGRRSSSLHDVPTKGGVAGCSLRSCDDSALGHQVGGGGT
jgi:hypothetical protein